MLERALVLAAQGVIGAEHLPADLRRGEPARRETAPAAGALLPLAEVEKRHVLGVLQAEQGNRERAARILGISRRTLLRMLQRWGESGS